MHHVVLRILIDTQDGAISSVAGLVFLPPDAVVIPLFSTTVASVFVPRNNSMRMLQIIASCVSTDGHGNFFSMKLLIGIVKNFFAKVTMRKDKVSTEKLGPERPIQ